MLESLEEGAPAQFLVPHAFVAPAVLSAAPDEEPPNQDADDHNHEGCLAGLGVRLPFCFLDLLLRLLLGGRAVGMAADGGLRQLLPVDARIRGLAADAGDVDLHEPIQHIPALSGEIVWNHVAGVVEEHVGEVPGVLVDASRLVFEGPVMAGRPHARRGLESGPAVPLHIVDQLFRADVVADEILIATEEKDGDAGLEEAGKQIHGRHGVLCQEGFGDRA